MAKRKEVCVGCGIANQEIHSMCFNCHDQDMEGMSEQLVSKYGNDYFMRCDEKDCWVCDTWKWTTKGQRPPKYTKKELLNRAKGRYGRGNKKPAIEELKRRGIDFS
jgi:hypothetical protein